MTVGSMFTGIGGLDLGFESEGFEVLWMCERDPFCRAALAKHWPGVPVYNDAKMSIAQWRQVPRPDVIIGGFPCQDVSNAGARAGLSGDRSGLWWCIRRAVRILGPQYVCIENVPGLFARGFDVVLRSLARVGRDAEWQVIRASDVGAPHLRARVFVVAYPQRDARRDLEQRDERGTPGDGEESGEAGERALADASDEGRGLECANDPGSGDGAAALRPGAAEPRRRACHDGTLDVADPNLGRLEGRRQPEPRGIECARGRQPDGRGEVWQLDDAAPDLGDPDGDGQRSGRREGRDGARDARPEPAPAGDLAAAAVTGPQRRGSGWPARPGEPQHGWEPPRVLASTARRRVADAAGAGRQRADVTGIEGEAGRASDCDARPSTRGIEPERDGRGNSAEERAAGAEPALGVVPDGVPRDLPGWRRAALQATGNAVVPQVGAVVARRVRQLAQEQLS